jgi:hypothetical protein
LASSPYTLKNPVPLLTENGVSFSPGHTQSSGLKNIEGLKFQGNHNKMRGAVKDELGGQPTISDAFSSPANGLY